MTSKVAIVTGASSGIGEVTASLLHQNGYAVYAGARRVERMKPLEDAGVVTRALDVTDDASMTAFVQGVIDGEGRVDVLVNNAGYGSYGALEEVPLDEARRQFEVNIFGLARMTQLVLPHMRAQRDGYVVNIGSMGGKLWEPLGSWYHATKFAVEGLSDSLRVELKPHGIKVVIIEPGVDRHRVARHLGRARPEQLLGWSLRRADRRAGKGLCLAGRLQPEVVAKAVLKAVRSKHPRTRYAIGQGAKPITYARRVMPDQAFDAILGRLYRPTPG